MKRIGLLFSLLIICFITTLQAQTPAIEPSPGLQKLHVFVGDWKGDVETKPGPWGPGDKWPPMLSTNEMILGGLFLQIHERWEDSSHQDLFIVGFDPDKRNYPSSVYMDDGEILQGIMTCDGNAWRFTPTRKISFEEDQYSTMTLAEDGMSRIDKMEISLDDKTGMPFEEGKWTIGPARREEIGV